MYTFHDLYLITALTSLHPGAGRSEFSTIDHQVQRDYRGLPVIRKSSMKGAIREHLNNNENQEHIFGGNHGKVNQLNRFINKFAEENKEADTETIKKIKTALNKQTHLQTREGHFSFHDASLFSIPVRSNVRPFFNVTSIDILKHFRRSLKTFEVEATATLIEELTALIKLIEQEGYQDKNAIIWGYSSKSLRQAVYLDEFDLEAEELDLNKGRHQFPMLNAWTHGNLVVASHSGFKLLIDDFHLPIIPRNSIKKGESKNLWYEQVLPPESRFYTYFGYGKEEEHLDDFTKAIHQKVIGVGANLSVGYGCCYFEKY